MATAHTTVVSNTKPSQGSSSYSTLPLLASRPYSPSAYSPLPESTTTIVAPRINTINGIRAFSSSARTASFANRRSMLPLVCLISKKQCTTVTLNNFSPCFFKLSNYSFLQHEFISISPICHMFSSTLYTSSCIHTSHSPHTPHIPLHLY